MIKYIQKLQAKKGFTLVELIVVIAIIGVLAAILIPTMLNYVTSSRVTSADTTASEIKKTIDNFLTECDTLGYGMLLSPNAKACISGGAARNATDGTGDWVLKVTAGSNLYAGATATTADTGVNAFKNKKDIGEWSGKDTSDTITHGTTRVSAGKYAINQLAWKLKDAFPDVAACSFSAYLEGGKTLYVAFTADGDKDTVNTEATLGLSLAEFQAGKAAFNNSTAGVSTKGYIVGTAPKLPIATTTA